jgi:hypothetical protein
MPRERERVRRELFGTRDDALRMRRDAQTVTHELPTGARAPMALTEVSSVAA